MATTLLLLLLLAHQAQLGEQPVLLMTSWCTSSCYC